MPPLTLRIYLPLDKQSEEEGKRTNERRVRFFFVIARIAVTGGGKTGRNEWRVDGWVDEGRETD